MLKRIVGAAASLSLMLAAGPALAQQTLQPAVEASLGSQGESAQAGSSQIVGYVLLAAFAVASVWALIEILDDDGDGTPVSP